MRKHFSILFGLTILLMVLIPTMVLADGDPYVTMDIKVDEVIGQKINNTDIKIYSSTSSDPANISDRTEEFEFLEKLWSVCVDDNCATTEEVSDNDVFEANKSYVLMIKIKGLNEADIDIWGSDIANYNGKAIDNFYGEYANTGKELMIKIRTYIGKTTTEDEPIVIATPEATPEVTEADNNENNEDKCLFGLSFCCTSLLGLSICVWVIIAIVVLLLIIILCASKKGKKKLQFEE